MYDFFIDHAIKNVWCNPGQDRQAIVKPARLTHPTGVMNKVQVMWKSIALPVLNKKFHVYQIGQINPWLLGLFPVLKNWTTLASICDEQNLIVDIYAATGIQLPRFETWYYLTENNDLIIAVKEQPTIPINLTTEDIYIRFYSNAYYNTDIIDPTKEYVEVFGKNILEVQDVLDLQNKYNAAVLLQGQTYVFVNGYKVSKLDLFSVKIGDIVEIVYDSSIYRVIDFNVSDLKEFTSTLDRKRKYLLHYNGEDQDTIDYLDDVDVFILAPVSNNQTVGLYYHRNQEDALRMVTHRDYSITIPYLIGYTLNNTDWNNPNNLIIRLHIRKSGYHRQLVNEANRIKELYKLPDDEIVQAMIGTNSVVPNWTAANLESSLYTKLMRDNLQDITRQEVLDAYGYNAVSKLIGDTPSFTVLKNQLQVIDVPFGEMEQGTAYEYDDSGVLLGWYNQWSNATYTAFNSDTRLVEIIPGYFGTTLEETYGDMVVDLLPASDYRMYTCPIVGGFPNNKWTDVTDSSKYTIIDNKLTWHIDNTEEYTLVRGNNVVLAYAINIMADDCVLRFTLEHKQTRNNETLMWDMQIPMGELDIFLNGKSLIENIDYYVNFPEIVIVNKEYLINPLTVPQNIAIRFSGFCNSDLTRTLSSDIGFINHSLLSNNTRFDIRDDKVLRIVVDGRLYDRNQLMFSENNTGVSVPNVLNGRPYLIRDIVIPVGCATGEGDTYQMRATSVATDKAISDYLTLRLPDQEFDAPTSILNRYQVYSPFCSNIIYDLATGVLNDPRIKTFLTDNDIFEICKPYEFLLKYEPYMHGIKADNNWLEVHPHSLNTTITLDIYSYRFISRVIRVYLKDAINLSHSVQISS